MVKGSEIVIERVANGWIVRNQFPHDGVLCFADVQVFNELDIDSLGVMDARTTVLGFIKEHFKAETA